MKAKNFQGKFKVVNTLILLSLFFAFFLCGCSSFFGDSAHKTSSTNSISNTVAWLNSGELSYGGPVPIAPQTAHQISGETANSNSSSASYNEFSYGFSPTAPNGPRSLILDTATKSAKLIQAGKELASAKLLDTTGLIAGAYKVAHKQRNPLWYAPQDYFSARGLPVPAEGDKKRYLRGAFGDFALFVSPTEAIHSGPFALSELSGARLEEQDFSKIFYLVEVGDSITIN